MAKIVKISQTKWVNRLVIWLNANINPSYRSVHILVSWKSGITCDLSVFIERIFVLSLYCIVLNESTKRRGQPIVITTEKEPFPPAILAIWMEKSHYCHSHRIIYGYLCFYIQVIINWIWEYKRKIMFQYIHWSLVMEHIYTSIHTKTYKFMVMMPILRCFFHWVIISLHFSSFLSRKISIYTIFGPFWWRNFENFRYFLAIYSKI